MLVLVGLDWNGTSLVPVYANLGFVHGRLVAQDVGDYNPDDVGRFDLSPVVNQIITGGGGGGGLVSIIGSAKVIHSAVSVGPTNFCTITSDGMYRVSAVCIHYAGLPTFSVDASISGNILPASSGNISEESLTPLLNGDILSYTVNIGAGSNDFSFYVVVEQLLV